MLPAQATFSNEVLNDLSDYFHGAPIGLQVANSDGTIKRTNLAELELLGYSDHPDEYVGHHLAEFHADPDDVRNFLDRLIGGEPVTEHETTLLRRDGTPQRVLLYANARVDQGSFRGIRCFTFPHPDDLRPDIAEVGALRDESIEQRQLNLSSSERTELYHELHDFFVNSPIALHIVGGDGLIKHASNAELNAMGYDANAYLGQHIARFHADQKVIDGMLEDLVGGTPLINFSATLFRSDGTRLPVMIYSNSRMRDGSFINTRCFTVPVPRARKAQRQPMEFSWPRNEDFGFTIAGRDDTAPAKPNPMTLALKYIASRKRPEESLGFLAEVSKVLAATGSLTEMMSEVASLTVPYLADLTSVDLATKHLAHAATDGLADRVDEILGVLARTEASVRESGETVARYELAVDSDDDTATALISQGLRSLLMVPLTIRGENVGTLTLLRDQTPARRNFGPADKALSEELARRISFAVEIDRLSRAG